jgi:hypothetical protein
MVQLKDHSYTFFLAVLLPHNAGLGLIFRLITTLILFRTFGIQRATAGAVLHGGHHINVLDYLEGKK